MINCKSLLVLKKNVCNLTISHDLIGHKMEALSPSEIEMRAAMAGLAMAEIFRRSGVSPSSFHRAKRGEGDMRPVTIFKLMKAIEGN
jgi:hypothetical protein